MAKTNLVTYRIDITCEISGGGIVVPVFASHVILDRKKRSEHLPMNDYPPAWKIAIIWFGKHFSYPLIEKNDK